MRPVPENVVRSYSRSASDSFWCGKLQPRLYSAIRSQIFNGDVLLFRRPGLIARAGRGHYSHAAMAGWWDLELMCLEMREWVGGRAVTLSSQVRKYSGCIDVYRPNCSLQTAETAFRLMRQKTGNPYNYLGILQASLLHLVGIRLIARIDANDDDDRRATVGDLPEFCSQAISSSYGQAGLDPVRNMPHSRTEPNNLAQSTWAKPLWTLLADPSQPSPAPPAPQLRAA